MYIKDSIFQLMLVATLGLVVSCSNPAAKQTTLQPGDWLFELQVDPTDPGRVLPFNVEAVSETELYVKNATERIRVTEITYSNDSVRITMPVFGSELKGKVSGDLITGNWHKYNAGLDYKIPFTASWDVKSRFQLNDDAASTFSGRWKSFFVDENDTSDAIGIFAQAGNKVTGTFLTETGDFRYLEGVAEGNQIRLSTFDGAHAFLFEASMNEQGELNGSFRSGHKYQARWLASRDESAMLADMKNLTNLKPGYDKLAFSFPDEGGNMVSLTDEKFRDKVVIVQIFGTWCPNCMDETRYLVELYNTYHEAGLEVIGLDFEPKPTQAYFNSRINRFRTDLNVPYTLLLAGHSNKEKAAESLPMLNHILSFPTAMILDKKGAIREIHTGFSGPGTGSAYDSYRKETEKLIEELLQE